MAAPSWKMAGATYLPTIAAVEQQKGIPEGLLARVAFQECSWRSEVINGDVVSSAGAVGMFQLEPADFPGAAAMTWEEQAETAGNYLAELQHEFSDWQLAVAAYDWGPGNVHKFEDGKLPSLPPETTKYVAQVFKDVPISGVLVNVYA